MRYVLIGGLAVGAHGYPRATKDVDIVPASDRPNLERLAALHEKGILSDEELVAEKKRVLG